MNAIESAIVTKITTEIQAAATAEERSGLISDLYTFLAVAEKRIALEARSLGSKLASEAESVLGAAETEGKKLVGE